MEIPEQNSDVRVLARGVGIALPGQLLGRAVIFMCHVVLARLLGPQTFGLYAIGWTILKMTGLVAAFGMPTGIVRMGSEEWGKNPARFRGIVFQSLGSALAVGALVGLALYLAAPWLAERVFHDARLIQVMRLFSPSIALAAGLEVGASATRVTKRMEFAILVRETIQPGLYLVLAVCALLLGGGLREVVVAAVTSYAVALLVVLVIMVRLFPELTAVRAGVESVLRDLIGLSPVYSLVAIFAAMMMWVDRLIVGAFRPAAEVGVYQAVSQASSLFSVIIGALGLIFGPMVAGLHVEEDRSRLLELFRVGTKWTMYVSLPILIVVWMAADDVVVLLYGSEYAHGAWALVVLMVGQVLNAATGPTASLLAMTGNHKVLMRLTGLGLLANCVLGVLLVPIYGIDGAAVSTAISLVGYSVASLAVAKRVPGAWPYDRRVLKVVAAALATAAVLWLILGVLPFDGWPRLAALSVTSLLGFALVNFALGVDKEDRVFLSTVYQIAISRSSR